MVKYKFSLNAVIKMKTNGKTKSIGVVNLYMWVEFDLIWTNISFNNT